MFGIDKDNFERYTNRRTKTVIARRYLIYFMVNELSIPFYHIKNYLPALRNHATAMHHFYKMRDEMDIYKDTELNYLEFKKNMLATSNFYITQEIKDKEDAIRALKEEVRGLEQISNYNNRNK